MRRRRQCARASAPGRRLTASGAPVSPRIKEVCAGDARQRARGIAGIEAHDLHAEIAAILLPGWHQQAASRRVSPGRSIG